MTTAGIIAEYNPFHNGHQYQIEELRARTNADFVIIAMSGDFVQRGEPAVFDKYIRTRMALNAGADLVLELPAAFAMSSAEDFAACGVALFDKLGIVDLLCFGSECGELAALEPAARLLADEPEEYVTLLRKRIALGDSFPKAREWAAAEYCRNYLKKDAGTFPELLSSPNNILGIEYMKALIRRQSSIKPYTIRRKGQEYHDSDFDAAAEKNSFASASAIRKALAEYVLTGGKTDLETGGNTGKPTHTNKKNAMETIKTQMPNLSALPFSSITPVFPDDLSAILNYRLLELSAEGRNLTDFSDVSPELSDRIGNQLLKCSTYSGRIEQLKTRQYTYTRISRALLHILLGTTKEQIQAYRANDYVSYARILGFRKNAGELLSELKKRSTIPLISKTADAERILQEEQALHSFRYDLHCAHTYQSIVYQKSGILLRNEYTQPIVIV